jgi:hypothetical protein
MLLPSMNENGANQMLILCMLDNFIVHTRGVFPMVVNRISLFLLVPRSKCRYTSYISVIYHLTCNSVIKLKHLFFWGGGVMTINRFIPMTFCPR